MGRGTRERTDLKKARKRVEEVRARDRGDRHRRRAKASKTGPFAFNGRYDDLDQVSRFYPEYEVVLWEITAAGKYPYNQDFEGKIPGLKGPDETTGIYLLQQLRHRREADRIYRSYLESGYKPLPEEGEPNSQIRYDSLVIYSIINNVKTQWRKEKQARVVFDERGQPKGILPKGKRTHGYPLNCVITGPRGVLVQG